jgi:hypothetical protein
MATGAQADELAALKAQLEALQARVSQLESQPALPALPPGTKLLTAQRGQGTYALNLPRRAREDMSDNKGYTIAVTPTADMPAPVSEVTVTGEIRVLALFNDYEVDGSTIDVNLDNVDDSFEESGYESDDFDLVSRGRLVITGRTETAIGEIGGQIRVEGTQDPGGGNPPGGSDDGTHGDGAYDAEHGRIEMDVIWGYWQMTPNFQFGAGYTGEVAGLVTGWDGAGNPDVIGGLKAGTTYTDITQVRLTYSSGGLTLIAGLHDNDQRAFCDGDCVDDHDYEAVFPTVEGKIQFDTGSFLVEAAGVWQQDDATTSSGNGSDFEDIDDNWAVAVGATVNLSDMFVISASASTGEGYFLDNLGGQGGENDEGYWNASGLLIVKFHEAMRVELGVAYSKYDHEQDEDNTCFNCSWDAVENSFQAGATLFWDPVDQLTLGAGVGFVNMENEGDDTEADFLTAGLGAWFRF